MSVKLYVEGAGPRRIQHQECRRAFRKFFESAGLANRMPEVVACGGRNEAFQSLRRALRTGAPFEIPALLVDAEDRVDPLLTTWQHLQLQDGWNRPNVAGDDRAFLMVQVMETWFLADINALAGYFGSAFLAGSIRKWPSLEEVPRSTIYEVLEKATAKCRQAYCKGRVSFELLARIDARKVEAACPHAKALLDYLRHA